MSDQPLTRDYKVVVRTILEETHIFCGEPNPTSVQLKFDQLVREGVIKINGVIQNTNITEIFTLLDIPDEYEATQVENSWRVEHLETGFVRQYKDLRKAYDKCVSAVVRFKENQK